MASMRYFVIITAGGSGQRMQSGLPKQFHILERRSFDSSENVLNVESKPILLRTIERFLSIKQQVELILVLPQKWIPTWRDYYLKNNMEFPHTIVEGGLSRFHSVRGALEKVPEGAVVAVHDAVRPFASKALIEKMLSRDFSGEYAGAIPYISAYDSMREVERDSDGKIIASRSIKREKLVMVQTPQVFNSTILKEAYKRPYSVDFTDDASVVEAAGYKVELVEGEKLNFKITTPEDKQAAQLIMNGLSFSSEL